MMLLLILLAALVVGALLWKILLLTLDAEDRGRRDIAEHSERLLDVDRVLTRH